MTLLDTPAWAALRGQVQTTGKKHLREFFQEDPQRAERFTLEFGKLHYDFSKQRIDAQTLSMLMDLARAAGLDKARAAMFGGEVINTSEKRRVLHVALRRSEGPFPAGCDVMPQVLETRRRCFAFAEGIRSGALAGSSGRRITDVVNIGIGGSDLGPKMMAMAMRTVGCDGPRVQYVSNLDGAQLATVLKGLDPQTTLFVICSKTFTTQETTINAKMAKRWLTENLPEGADLSKHLAAVSSKTDLAGAFGIPAERVFAMWDWVGGRFSLWSAVGLSLMIAIGPQAYARMLAAAEAMDRHFVEAPLERNLPAVMAMIGIWNTNFLGAETLAVLPYNDSLKFFPSFLQQLEMESNGKSVGRDGKALPLKACPVVWGELGNNGQHAFFQLLHQGGRTIPCDFIAAARADMPLPGHQEALLSNCFAQSSALAFGKTGDEVRESMRAEGKSEAEIEALVTQRTFPGNQPSSTLMLEDLSPESLGALVALYEHKVFVQGVIWGVNSFDQWGVELGKAVARRILPKLSGTDSSQVFDASTEALIAYTRKHI